MPFDGVPYGACPLIRPYSYHPKTGASGAVLAGALAGSYMFARNQGALIGHQTWPHFLASTHFYHTTGLRGTLSSTTAIDLCAFRRWIPAHATHVLAEIHFMTLAEIPSIAFHSVKVVSTGTDTGATFETDTPGSQARAWHYGEQWSSFETTHPGRGVARCAVELVNVSPNLPARADVTVLGHATSDDGSSVTATAARYRPDFVAAWWICSE